MSQQSHLGTVTVPEDLARAATAKLSPRPPLNPESFSADGGDAAVGAAG